jgi:hypothetical protein
MGTRPTPDQSSYIDDVPSLAEHQRLQEEIVAEGGNPIQDTATMKFANEVTPLQPPDDTTPSELLYNQAAATRFIVAHTLYPSLRLRSNDQDWFECHLHPTSYQESFKSRWSTDESSHGYLNQIFSYGGTERIISMSFVLPAISVLQSRFNLDQCSRMSKMVYGKYRNLSVESEQVRVLTREKTFRADFGSLIRNEKVVVSKFSFSVDPDAGAFDYDGSVIDSEGNSIDSDVTHSTKGLLLPKQISVDVEFIVIHDDALGFGGSNRIPGIGDLKWAENKNRDWPHGTGHIYVQSYMRADNITGNTAISDITGEDGEELTREQKNAIFRSRYEGLRTIGEGPE